MEENSQKCSGLLNEQTGIDRIREALQAHTWPNMTMKHDKTKLDTASREVKNKAKAEDKKSEDLQSREIIGN